MLKQAGKIALVISLLVIPSHFLLAQQEENITITTYYPSPYGSYNELRTNKMVIGETSSSNLAAPSFAGALTFKPISTEPAFPDTFPPGTMYFDGTVFKYSADGSTWKDLGGTVGKIEAYNSGTSSWDVLGTLQYVGLSGVWDTDGNEYTFPSGKVLKNGAILKFDCRNNAERNWPSQGYWGIANTITDADLNDFCKYCYAGRTMTNRGSAPGNCYYQLYAEKVNSSCTPFQGINTIYCLWGIECCHVYSKLRWQ